MTAYHHLSRYHSLSYPKMKKRIEANDALDIGFRKIVRIQVNRHNHRWLPSIPVLFGNWYSSVHIIRIQFSADGNSQNCQLADTESAVKANETVEDIERIIQMIEKDFENMLELSEDIRMIQDLLQLKKDIKALKRSHRRFVDRCTASLIGCALFICFLLGFFYGCSQCSAHFRDKSNGIDLAEAEY